ncbi:MAG: Rpn family recombination-promoting nuclease/putative transposase [Synergistaceae bacterium]|nr:Rpn family recombination-promoting nuclease/putative transposase [Synergistaceae bacterium]MBQ6982478.1 Rpn family recombination-promoting nuclease/putative transposase [Synergistaceae bacterium]
MKYKDFESILPPSQRWENLTLANDFLFGKVMRDHELCTEMIRRILPHIDIGHIAFTHPQKSAKYSLDTRGVRFDVFASSDKRKLFDCEVQTSDKKDLPRRTRAYHSILGLEALEAETLKKSGSYSTMPDTYVIFLCTFDHFNLGRHIYTFSNVCDEVRGLKLNDGAVTIFLNTRGKADDISEELKAFLDFMMGKPSGDPFIRVLEERVKLAKLNAKWRRVYMLEMLHDWEISNEARNAGHEEGRNKGLIEGRNEMFNFAIDFLKSKGMSNDEINDFRNAAMQSQRWEAKS